VLSASTTEAVLGKLGFSAAPEPDRAGLDAVYAAWCRRVPSDNLVKRIHLASGSAAPFPNGPPEAFFSSWLQHGTGGTCWPSAGGLHALLVSLGFDARRGSAAMFDNLTGPIHTHGTTIVRIYGADHWVDSSMLTYAPLPLVPRETTVHDDPVSPVWSEPVGALWRIWWTGAIDAKEIGCLLLDDDTSAEHYLARYEASRGMSPFNTMLYATHNTDDARVTLTFDTRFERRADGITETPLGAGRERILVEEFGYSEEIAARLPADDLGETDRER
jgi:N-hydroxyarylamine O-acetyltransferase